MSQNIAAANGGSIAATDGGDAPAKAGFWALTLGSIGVVYGDIGTSPLYALARVGAGRGRCPAIRRASRWCSASCR